MNDNETPHEVKPIKIVRSRSEHLRVSEMWSAGGTPAPAASVKLVNHGGKVLDGRTRVFNLYLGTPIPDVAGFDAFSKLIIENGYYVSPDGTDTASGKFIGSLKTSWPFPSMKVDDSAIESYVDQAFANVPGLRQDGYTILALMFPAGSIVTMEGMSSCVDFCGYHNRTANGNYYMVLCDTTCPGCHGGESPTQGLQMTYAHEYGESRSDPDGNAWFVSGSGTTMDGEENGDLCAWDPAEFGPAGATDTVQPLYVNDRQCTVGVYTPSVPVPAKPKTVAMAIFVGPVAAIVGIPAFRFGVVMVDADGNANNDDNATIVTVTLHSQDGTLYQTGGKPSRSAMCLHGTAMFDGDTFSFPHPAMYYEFTSPGLLAVRSEMFAINAAGGPPPTGDYATGYKDGYAAAKVAAGKAVSGI